MGVAAQKCRGSAAIDAELLSSASTAGGRGGGITDGGVEVIAE